MTEGAGLKLRARDAADLAIIAACLQDALIRPRDMIYLAEEKRFGSANAEFAHRTLDEVGLFIEASHACYERLTKQAASAAPAAE